MASKMYIEKSLEYTFKGIELLRDETIQLFQNRNNYLSFGTGAVGLLFYSAATSQYNYPFLTYVMLLLVIPLLSCFLIVISLYINVQIINLGRYLRSREMLLTYLLESIYEDDKKRVFNIENGYNLVNLTDIQKQIVYLFFMKNPTKFKSSINYSDKILRNQTPIYWERYILNPIPDKLKAIDLQSYMITWMFSIIALTSYCSALIFRASVQTRCQVTTWKCTLKISDLMFFNDIYFFRNYNFDFFKQYSDYLRNLLNIQDDKIIIFCIAAFLVIVSILLFLLRVNAANPNESEFLKEMSIYVIFFGLFLFILGIFIFEDFYLFVFFVALFAIFFGESIIFWARKRVGGSTEKKATKKELTEHNMMPILKDYYSLFLNLTFFLLVMYFLRFHTELSVFLIILSTFSYSIFWQIPQFRKTAYRPLNEDIFIEENYYD